MAVRNSSSRCRPAIARSRAAVTVLAFAMSAAAPAAFAAPASAADAPALVYAQHYDLADAEATTSGNDFVRVSDGGVDVIDAAGGARRVVATAGDPAAQCWSLASELLATSAAMPVGSSASGGSLAVGGTHELPVSFAVRQMTAQVRRIAVAAGTGDAPVAFAGALDVAGTTLVGATFTLRDGARATACSLGLLVPTGTRTSPAEHVQTANI